MKANISFITIPNYSRSLSEAKKGIIAITTESIWLKQIDQKDFFSVPLFKQGEFQKGFFALPARRKEIEKVIELNQSKNITPLQTLRKYSVITSPNWIFDLAAINQLGVITLTTTKVESMCKMIEYGRGDLYLGELIMNRDEDLLFNCNGLFLEPIKGIKVVFKEPRHFVVSKKYPNSEKIFHALQTGIEVLRKTGEMKRALYPIAKNKKKIDSWQDLLPLSLDKNN
jgi:hypothetical protein